MSNRHMQRYASLMIREVQIKTTKSHHLISVMAIIKKTTNNIRWWGCMKGTCIHYWWEHKVVQPIWKTVWKFLKKLNKTIQDVWIKILWWERAGLLYKSYGVKISVSYLLWPWANYLIKLNPVSATISQD